MTTRRLILKRLGGAVFARPDALLDAASGMVSAAYIIRRDGFARHRSAGMALHPGNRWDQFDERRPFRVASVSKMVCTFGFHDFDRARSRRPRR